jgi:TolB-like protein/Flp pilus assembly protein TadD
LAFDKPGLFEELKRRHVVRVAIAYLVAAWLLVQVATQLFPFFDIPDWVVRLVVVLLAIGLPVAVAFAWIYELTPEGIRRTEAADSPGARSAHASRQIGRKLNSVIIAVLVLAVALLGWRLLALRRASTPSAMAQAAAPASSVVTPVRADTAIPVPDAIPQKSVAVLPFVNDSGQKDEQFFSDGLSQDLITALSQFAGLKVINRDSAFQFRDSKDNIKTIAQQLGVAHILEGSVQRAEGEVRITATLVNATDGSILWSQRYDKPYKDLFALQDAITQSVADALKAKLLTAPGAAVQSDRPPSGNLDAYVAYLRGLNAFNLGTEASLHAAVAAIEQAVRIDPNYAAAYAQLSRMWVGLADQYSDGDEVRAVIAKARAAADTALKLAPDSSLAHQARSNLLESADMDWSGAEAEAQRALQLAPNDANAKFFLGSILGSLGQVQRAVDLTRQALQADPRNASWYQWLSVYLRALGRLDDAARAANTGIALQPRAAAYHEQLAVIEILRGDGRAAMAAAQKETDPGWRRVALALATQIGPDAKAADGALRTLITQDTREAPYQIAEVYALRRDPGAVFQWLDRAWKERDPGVAYLLFDPLILRYRDDPRFAAFCHKVGLPTTTDAVAMK